MTKKLKMRYQDIIKSLENTIGSDKSNDSTFLQAIDKEVIKNAETENIILENLNQLENKKQFTIKGISLAQMAVMLKTNTKYLNYVLKKHRNADFSKYINY
ncbi:hypothetical protein [Chryseobacterium sp.]|uniref:hypothetical protein n=1 Tax=Chryseobacterium sp. TaxID=1871047 RepID=UPI00388FD66E